MAGAEPVVLYASISVLNLMRAANGSQCKEIKRGVTWALLGSLKASRSDRFDAIGSRAKGLFWNCLFAANKQAFNN